MSARFTDLKVYASKYRFYKLYASSPSLQYACLKHSDVCYQNAGGNKGNNLTLEITT